eukprot:g1774.t1
MFHESQFASDLFIKTFCHSFGLAGALCRDEELSVGFCKLSTSLSLARYVGRICGGYSGILVEIDNLQNNTFLENWKEPWCGTINSLQSLALLFYYPLEHLAWAGWTAPQLIGSRINADECGRASCFGWLAWITLNIVQVFFRMKELKRIKCRVENWKDDDAAAIALAKIKKVGVGLRLEMYRNLCFFLPAVQYCLKPDGRLYHIFNPILPQWLTQGLCLAESLIGYYKLWKGYSCSRPNIKLEEDKDTKCD